MKELAKVLLQLAIIGIASFVIKYLVERHKEQAMRERDLSRLRRLLLRRVSSAYRDVIRARSLIDGNRSALIYGKQMMGVIPSVQAKLTDVVNEMDIADVFKAPEKIKRHLVGWNNTQTS